MLYLFSLLIFIITFSNVYSGATENVICYYSSWARYRKENGAYTPDDIDPKLCSHLYYAFLGIETNGTLSILDAWGDVELGGFQKVADLKNVNPNLKILVSVGGWNAGNGILTNIAATPEYRQNLITSSIEFFQKWNYDGLDIDWEYPEAADKENFITLLSELKAAYQPNGYLLTAAVSAIPIDDAYDIPAMANVLDFINLMTYDFHVATQGVTGQNSPLYASSQDNNWQKEYENVNASVVQWLLRGAIAEKLTIGLGFYGHTFTLTDPSNNGIGAPVSDVGEAGPYTNNEGTLAYYEICEFCADWTRVWDDEQQVPYTYSNDQWVGYDDKDSIVLKVNFAKSLNLGGVMVWSIDMDDFRGTCGTKYILLNAVIEAI